MPSDVLPDLEPRTIAVGVLRIDDMTRPIDDLVGLLSPDERTRAAAFRFDEDRHRYTVVRSSLRVLLGAYTAEPPDALRFGEGANGKPHLATDTDLEFNVSHSANGALFGFTRGRAIGVDIERIRDTIDIDSLSERFMSASERQALRDLPNDERLRRFYRIWTRKEACVKGTGLGLSLATETFSVDLDDHEPADLGDHGAWATREIAVDPGYVAAIAAPSDDHRVSPFDAGTVVSASRTRKPNHY